jgi:hypothetical protein
MLLPKDREGCIMLKEGALELGCIIAIVLLSIAAKHIF